jgi:hypothetical protein
MAFNTTLELWKRYEFNGGSSDSCVIAWPAAITARGEIRHRYHSGIDILPTILDCLRVQLPETIRATCRAGSTGSACPTASTTGARRAVVRRSSTRCSARARSGMTDGRPLPQTRRSAAGATSTSTPGSSTTLKSTAPKSTTSLISIPEAARADRPLVLRGAPNHAFPLDDPSAVEILNTPRPASSGKRVGCDGGRDVSVFDWEPGPDLPKPGASCH